MLYRVDIATPAGGYSLRDLVGTRLYRHLSAARAAGVAAVKADDTAQGGTVLQINSSGHLKVSYHIDSTGRATRAAKR